MPLGGVIFDWDGVVINSATLHKKSWEILADELISLSQPIISNLDSEKKMR
jgi:beta-phosphoglucomutase-like phosphatase (HAD superfamily)